MIRRRAVLDTVNPPGQARYLRDVIARINAEDRLLKEPKGWFPDDKRLPKAVSADSELDRLLAELRHCLTQVGGWSAKSDFERIVNKIAKHGGLTD